MGSAYKEALSQCQATERAACRQAAVYSGRYTLKDSATSRVLGTGLSTEMSVSFSLGLENGGVEVTEIARVMGEEDLRQVLFCLVEAGRAELLKPHNIASKSHSTWWSLVRHGGKNVEETILALLPDHMKKAVSFKRHRNVTKYGA